MKKLLICFIFCFHLIPVHIRAMDLGSVQDASKSRVSSLQKIAANFLAKEPKFSYLSRPTASELTKVEEVLGKMPADLWPEITATQPREISISGTNFNLLPIDALVEYPDATKIAMTSSSGYLLGIDLLDQTGYAKKISFDSAFFVDSSTMSDPEDNDDRYDAWRQEWLDESKEKDLSSDYAFSSDSEIFDEVSIKTEVPDKIKEFYMDTYYTSDYMSKKEHHEDLKFEDTSYKSFPANESYPALSPDGRIWGAVSTGYNDRLLIGEIKDIFEDTTKLEGTAALKVKSFYNVAQELGVHSGELSNLVIKSDNIHYAAVWQPMSSRLTDTHKILFCKEDGAVVETEDMPRIKSLLYAHNEPLVAVEHVTGNVSLWNFENATRLEDIDFFGSEDPVTSAVAFSHDDSMIYAGNMLGDVCALNRDSKQGNRRNHVHSDMVKIIQSHPQGLCVATASSGEVRLWNKDMTQNLEGFKFPVAEQIIALNFSHDGTFLYVLCDKMTPENKSTKEFHRIPLGNSLELLTWRAWHACKDKADQREMFKNWIIYTEMMMKEPHKENLLSATLRAYFAQQKGSILGKSLCAYFEQEVGQ